MGKRKSKEQNSDKGHHVRWEMSMTVPGPHGQTIERNGDGIVILNYVPLEEWFPARRLAWDRLWRDLLLTPRPDVAATDQERESEAKEESCDGE